MPPPMIEQEQRVGTGTADAVAETCEASTGNSEAA